MVKRSKRGSINTQQILPKLAEGRQGAISVCTQAKVPSPEYTAASKVTQAIDDLAEQLTGDRSHFHLKPHG